MLNQTVAHYRILERLGNGEMGEVYKAEDLQLNRAVAIKLLTKDLCSDHSAAMLNHPNIATIHEMGRHDNLSFIVMEFVEGENLEQLIGRSRLEITEAVDIAIQAAEALKATHDRGLIHCDIKSSNIMLNGAGIIKVLDFGLARPADSDGEGAASGTIGYMSPEQARGEKLDSRTDIFSLGVVLYEMITNRKPFQGEAAIDLLDSLQRDEPKAMGAYRDDLPLDLESIVRSMLEKNRDDRYRSANELLSDLKSLRKQLNIHSLEKESSTAISRTEAAFRGLLPFQEADRDRFYEREFDTNVLFSMITHEDFRFGLLYGESGCGKTSLLRAGLLPRLWDEGYLPIYCRSNKNLLTTLIQECRKQSQIDPMENEPLVGYLERISEELGSDLVIILDQFEEFFVNFKTQSEREPFISFITDCYKSEGIPIRFLLSMRSDFLYLINSEFADSIPDPLMSSRLYHLRNFGEEQAARIIERSARRANLPLEEELSRHVAADLAVNGVVLSSELQIVGEQLQSKRIFNLKDYLRAGGKEPLVHAFLEDVIQMAGDREGAQMLLHSLISEENTRLVLSIDEISKKTQRGPKKIEQLLSLFVRARLIREVQDDEPWRYELMHEYLIEKINQVASKVLNATQRANRLFRQYLSGYTVDRRTRIPLGTLWLISRYSDLKRGEREWELLRKSLGRGLLRLSSITVLMAMVTILLTAALTVSEGWEEVLLSDGHTGAALQVVFSPNGKYLVSTGRDKKVIVWDFERRERRALLSEHTEPVFAIAFSPDGRWLATGGDDRKLIVWNVTTWEKAAELNGHSNKITAVGFSPDNRLLVSNSFDNQAIVWDVSRWEKVNEFQFEYPTNDILFLPNGRQIIHSNGQTLDLLTGRETAAALWKETYNTYGIALSRDASRMICSDSNGYVTFLDLARKTILKRAKVHEEVGRDVAFSPDGRLAASASEVMLLWDTTTQSILARLEYTSSVWSLAFSPDNRRLVSSHTDGSILLWDVAERKRVAGFNGHSEAVTDLIFSPDGKRLVSASDDRSAIIWDAESGKKERVLTGYEAKLAAVAFSPDGELLASCDYEGTTILWDLNGLLPRWALRKSERPNLPRCECLAISPDGRWVAAAGSIYDLAGEKVYENRWHSYGLDFSPDGRRLACVTDGKRLEIIETGRWKWIASGRLDKRTMHTVDFSPDGELLVTGDGDGIVTLWSVNPLLQIGEIGRHKAGISKVLFSPDGQRIASAGGDKTIMLWDVEKRSLITEIGSHSASVSSIAFSPDGRRLASGEQDRSVRIYTRHRTLWGYRFD
jgi:WD40 repeat protein/serine/threonine protein kinase